MIRLWDGLLSLLAATACLGIVGVPVWGAVRALQADLLPIWAWGPVLLLAAAGMIVTLSFSRKAYRGVHPLRERRR